ncbi:hypothetical protein [Neorhizobium galegae]|uniref:Uncharacterized protein n=1 Tax=Neorhizobium galegae bv. orientalis str. HAMBI 540 TaxID=1028800 RepID=A0A068SM26_NEOGA|nr:hypothetical protein [Neorhizobium galegae]MCQ1855835.1 hypothetical protein [Neorhizobium galegae]CDN46859.1 Hypothetical protein RG540_CH06690 [Neorhizobium galegae bv. orientalis str. HAMBI 540]
MAGHSSDFSDPSDHMLKTTELEAVVKWLRDKIKEIESPEPPDLTEVKDDIKRLFKTNFNGAGVDGGGWSSDPKAINYFDDPDRQRSMFSTIFGIDGYGAAWTQFLTVSTSSSVMRLTYGNETNIAQWLDTNGKSLSTVTLGSTEALDALSGKSVIEKAIGTPEMINAIGTKTALELVFGNATRAATWVTSLRSLAEGVYGDSKPNITHDPIIMRIASIEARLTALGG